MMDVIVIASLFIAIVPQAVYEIYLLVHPDFQFSWEQRDRFFLFSTTSHLTSIVILIASILFVRVMGKRMDSYDELLERGLSDYQQLKNKLFGLAYDLDSLSPAVEELLQFYHSNKEEVKSTMRLVELITPIAPAILRRYGRRLRRWDRLTPAEQDEAVKSIFSSSPPVRRPPPARPPVRPPLRAATGQFASGPARMAPAPSVPPRRPL